MIKIIFSLSLIGFCLLLPPIAAFAATGQALPPPVAAAIELWKLITPDKNRDIFDDLILNPVVGNNAPLARYRPENGGTVDIGQNLREYRRDYIYLASPIDMSTKPDFDQYLAVMIMLSLSNEATHILQDRNGSLKDFYKLYQSRELKKACSLYALQQHVSDIMMLKTAIRAESLFLGRGSTRGINALRLALEKNNLLDEFEEFRESMKNRNIVQLNLILSAIRSKRNDVNMSGLKFCQSSGNVRLDSEITKRAIKPVGYPFDMDSPTTPKVSLIYNP